MYLDYRYASGLPFINADKIAVTGVSYGGYIATLMLAERHTDLLACGVAVSPVVDWRFYGMYYIIHNTFWIFSGIFLSSENMSCRLHQSVK